MRGDFQYFNTALETTLMMEWDILYVVICTARLFRVGLQAAGCYTNIIRPISINVQRQFTPNIAINRKGYSLFRYCRDRL